MFSDAEFDRLTTDPYVTKEQYYELLKEGRIGMSYTDVYDAIHSLPTRKEQERALAGLFTRYGLDISEPIKVGKYFEERLYVMRQSHKGQVITIDDFAAF